MMFRSQAPATQTQAQGREGGQGPLVPIAQGIELAIPLHPLVPAGASPCVPPAPPGPCRVLYPPSRPCPGKRDGGPALRIPHRGVREPAIPWENLLF